jgi:hypothetical protein
MLTQTKVINNKGIILKSKTDKNQRKSQAWWQTPAIPVTWETEAERFQVRGH